MSQSSDEVIFLDAEDNIGWITSDLSIEYDGPAHVEAYVTDVANTTPCEEQAIADILLDMVHDLDIREVRRISFGGARCSRSSIQSVRGALEAD